MSKQVNLKNFFQTVLSGLKDTVSADIDDLEHYLIPVDFPGMSDAISHLESVLNTALGIHGEDDKQDQDSLPLGGTNEKPVTTSQKPPN